MKPLKLITILFALVLLFVNISFADDDIDDVKSKLPKLLGATNVGNDFWFTVPPCYDEAGGGHDNFIKIFVTSMFNTVVNIDVPSKGFHTQKTTVPNDVVEFNITPTIAQCYLRSPSQPGVPERVYPGYGIHIYSKEPIIVYCVIRFYATSDGFLVLPTSTLGEEYIVASYGDMGAMYNGHYPSLSGIVAAYDQTMVSFTLGGNNLTETGGGMKPGDITTKTLNKGDVWMFSSATYEGDLTGSKVVSTKPVAVVSGNFCTNIPITNRWCDYTVEMDLPTHTWGLDYHIAKVPGRSRAPLTRIFAKEPNTNIFRDGKGIGYIQQSGGVINKGYLEMRLVPFEADPRSAVISGDKPINVVLYNPGVEEDGYPLPNSDPFVMGTVPMENHYNDITFCTPGIYGGYGFNENYLNIVFETDQSGMIPDDMIFGQVSGGAFKWEKLSTVFSSVVEEFEYDVDGKKYAATTITLPKDGVYRIHAEKPFAAYSFGYSWCDSYGYPAAGVLLNPHPGYIDIDPPTPTWAENGSGIIEGNVSDGPDEEQSKLGAIFFHDSYSENCSFTNDEIVIGETQSANWNLKIAKPLKDAKALITFTDKEGNDTTVKVSYNAPKLKLDNETFDYGAIDAGELFEHEYKLSNFSENASYTIQSVSLENGALGFNVQTPEMPAVIPPQGNITIKVQFTNESIGTYKDKLIIDAPAGTLLDEEIKISTAQASLPLINVSDVAFGAVEAGSSVAMEFTIANEGNADLLIHGCSGPSQSVFSTDLPRIDNDNLLTIHPMEEFDFTVYAMPDKPGVVEDLIEFRSNADLADYTCRITMTAEEEKVKKVYVSDVDFELLEGQKNITKEFFIRNTGNEILTVKNITEPKYDFIQISGPSIPTKIGESEQIVLTVTITAPDKNIPEFRDTIYINTDADEGDALMIITGVVQTGVKDEEMYDYGITMYPLPANEIITIENSNEFHGKTMLKVSDIEGRTVISREIVLNPGDKFKLDVSGLSTGTYMLQMEAGGKIFVGKITIER